VSQVVNVNQRLAALTAAGTSVWLDQIRRSLTQSGELHRLVEEDCLRGVTSNPAIFEKAILGSPDYDGDLEALAREGLSAREVCRRMAVKDVQLACDVLRPVYDESGGEDGYVSLEVAPRLAHDTEGTLEQARQYWGLVDRPNVMIKIPATDEGIPAIEAALYEGLNINITLLFAVSKYERVMDAFISAMERRHAEGKPLDRHSVASFFVSRVDSEVDKRLDAIGTHAALALRGTAAVANARLAYQAYLDVFGTERWATLQGAGAKAQRPLWASTGVKNKAYPDTLYVTELVAPNTVNTMPEATLDATADHGQITGDTITGTYEQARADLDALGELGISYDDVVQVLEDEGVAKFEQSWKDLLASTETELKRLAPKEA
jgi:transaldolase